MYAVTPLPWCPHLDQVQPLPSSGVDVMSPCVECGHMGENWVCLTCYEVHLRFIIYSHGSYFTSGASVMDCHAMTRGSIPGGNGVKTKLHVLRKGQ